VLALVTWHQQEDRHWFGGRIPGQVQAVEFVVPTLMQLTGQTTYGYESYEGTPLAKTLPKDWVTAQPKINARIAAITGMRASVMP
jgi:hypothetical protein